jgi:hypothetical protein
MIVREIIVSPMVSNHRLPSRVFLLLGQCEIAPIQDGVPRTEV